MWHKAIRYGREDVRDKQCAEHPSSSQTKDNVAKFKAFMDSDHRMSVHIIVDILGLTKLIVH